MNSSFSFSYSSSTNKSTKKNERSLSPQEEYWLDRILRNHSGQIFILIFLLLLLLLSIIYYSVRSPGSSSQINQRTVIQIYN